MRSLSLTRDVTIDGKRWSFSRFVSLVSLTFLTPAVSLHRDNNQQQSIANATIKLYGPFVNSTLKIDRSLIAERNNGEKIKKGRRGRWSFAKELTFDLSIFSNITRGYIIRRDFPVIYYRCPLLDTSVIAVRNFEPSVSLMTLSLFARSPDYRPSLISIDAR